MKVLIINTVLLNGGDAAILQGLIKQLRSAFGDDATMVIGETQPSAASTLYPELSLIPSLKVVVDGERTSGKRSLWGKVKRVASWYLNVPRLYAAATLQRRGVSSLATLMLRRAEREVFQHYHTADLVVATGGTYLVEHYWLGPIIFDLNVVRRLRKPTAFFTQSLGPFRKLKNRLPLRKIFDHASLIMVRDQPSSDAVRDLIGSNSKTLIVPDAAFALGPADDRPSSRVQQKTQEDLQLKIAISVRFWPNFSTCEPDEGQRRYRLAIANAVSHLVENHGARVTFLSTCQGVPGYAFDDSREADQIADLLSASVRQSVTIERSYRRPDELLRDLTAYSFVIATRMHMAILSLVAGKPVMPVAYEFKTVELFKDSKLDRWVTDIENIEPTSFCALIDVFIDQLATTRDHVKRLVAKQRVGIGSGEQALASLSATSRLNDGG